MDSQLISIPHHHLLCIPSCPPLARCCLLYSSKNYECFATKSLTITFLFRFVITSPEASRAKSTDSRSTPAHIFLVNHHALKWCRWHCIAIPLSSRAVCMFFYMAKYMCVCVCNALCVWVAVCCPCLSFTDLSHTVTSPGRENLPKLPVSILLPHHDPLCVFGLWS